MDKSELEYKISVYNEYLKRYPIETARRFTHQFFKEKYPSSPRNRIYYGSRDYFTDNTLYVGDSFKIPQSSDFEERIIEVKEYKTVALRCDLISSNYQEQRREIILFASYLSSEYIDIDGTIKSPKITGYRENIIPEIKETKTSKNKLYKLCQLIGNLVLNFDWKEQVIPQYGKPIHVRHFSVTEEYLREERFIFYLMYRHGFNEERVETLIKEMKESGSYLDTLASFKDEKSIYTNW